MKLIDGDALIKKLESNSWNIDEWELPHEQVSAGLMANAMDKETVEGMPTVDAVPVIRCKDCIHAVKYLEGEYLCYCSGGRITTAEGFCDKGEEK